MLTCWLPTDTPNRLPPNASHQASAPACVSSPVLSTLYIIHTISTPGCPLGLGKLLVALHRCHRPHPCWHCRAPGGSMGSEAHCPTSHAPASLTLATCPAVCCPCRLLSLPPAAHAACCPCLSRPPASRAPHASRAPLPLVPPMPLACPCRAAWPPVCWASAGALTLTPDAHESHHLPCLCICLPCLCKSACLLPICLLPICLPSHLPVLCRSAWAPLCSTSGGRCWWCRSAGAPCEGRGSGRCPQGWCSRWAQSRGVWKMPTGLMQQVGASKGVSRADTHPCSPQGSTAFWHPTPHHPCTPPHPSRPCPLPPLPPLPLAPPLQGEDISEAAVREVAEETGVRTTFAAVLAMRQAHGLAVGQKSDLFFVSALKPEPGQEVGRGWGVGVGPPDCFCPVWGLGMMGGWWLGRKSGPFVVAPAAEAAAGGGRGWGA